MTLEVIKSRKKSFMRSVASVVHVHAFSFLCSISNLSVLRSWIIVTFGDVFANSAINYFFEQLLIHKYIVVCQWRKYICWLPLLPADCFCTSRCAVHFTLRTSLQASQETLERIYIPFEMWFDSWIQNVGCRRALSWSRKLCSNVKPTK